MDKRLSKETADLKLEIQNLGKKLHYLETTHKNSREHIDQIFNGGGRGWERLVRWRRPCGLSWSMNSTLLIPTERTIRANSKAIHVWAACLYIIELQTWDLLVILRISMAILYRKQELVPLPQQTWKLYYISGQEVRSRVKPNYDHDGSISTLFRRGLPLLWRWGPSVLIRPSGYLGFSWNACRDKSDMKSGCSENACLAKHLWNYNTSKQLYWMSNSNVG